MGVVLGICNGSDPAACLLRGGRLLAAARESRFRSMSAGGGFFPHRAIQWCLQATKLAPRDLQQIACTVAGPGTPTFSCSPLLDPIARFARAAESWLAGGGEETWREAVAHAIPAVDASRVSFRLVPYPEAQLAGTGLTSAFPEAVCLSLDALGGEVADTWGFCSRGHVSVNGLSRFPHSLEVFYAAMTYYLGLRVGPENRRLRRLAACGTPRFASRLREMVCLNPGIGVRVNSRFLAPYRPGWAWAPPEQTNLFTDAVEEYLGPARVPGAPFSPRHLDLAASVERVYQEILHALLERLYAEHRIRCLNVCGTFLHKRLAIAQIPTHSPFSHVHVPLGSLGTTNAIGAALSTLNGPRSSRTRFQSKGAAWGPRLSTEAVGSFLSAKAPLLARSGLATRCPSEDHVLSDEIANVLAVGEDVAWVQGPSDCEPGPWLDSCLLVDPRRSRPPSALGEACCGVSHCSVAACVPREHLEDWAELDTVTRLPGFLLRADRQSLLPALAWSPCLWGAHPVAGSERPALHSLLKAFGRISGIPVLMAAAWEDLNEPVQPLDQALDLFAASSLHHLVLGQWIVSRKQRILARPASHRCLRPVSSP